MNEEEFTSLSLPAKWDHLKKTMDYIVQMDSAYSMRRRLNPHHPEKDKKQEERNLRLDQYQRWAHIKALYSVHRDELANTLENEEYAKCKSIFEKIFTQEVDDALRNIIGNEDMHE
jgi:hypothetical protein